MIDAMPAQLEALYPCDTDGARRDTKHDVVRAARRRQGNRAVAKLTAAALPAPGERRPDLTDLQRLSGGGAHEDPIVRRMELEYEPRREQCEVRKLDVRHGRRPVDTSTSRKQRRRRGRYEVNVPLFLMTRVRGPRRRESLMGGAGFEPATSCL